MTALCNERLHHHQHSGGVGVGVGGGFRTRAMQHACRLPKSGVVCPSAVVRDADTSGLTALVCCTLLCMQVVIDVTNPWQSDYAKLAASTFAPNLTCDINDVEHSKDVDSAGDSNISSASACTSLNSAHNRDQDKSTSGWRSKGV